MAIDTQKRKIVDEGNWRENPKGRNDKKTTKTKKEKEKETWYSVAVLARWRQGSATKLRLKRMLRVQVLSGGGGGKTDRERGRKGGRLDPWLCSAAARAGDESPAGRAVGMVNVGLLVVYRLQRHLRLRLRRLGRERAAAAGARGVRRGLSRSQSRAEPRRR